MAESQSPQPSSVLFARGVIARLEIWATLRLAVQEGWGGPSGPQKRTWLASAVVDAFEEVSPPPDDQYIEEMLLQVMVDEFDTTVEDGSAEDVAKDIVLLWDDTRAGKDGMVVKFEGLADKLRGKKTEAQPSNVGASEEWEDVDDEDDSEDGEDDGDDDEEVPQLIERKPKNEPEVDEDGFTLVKGKSRR